MNDSKIKNIFYKMNPDKRKKWKTTFWHGNDIASFLFLSLFTLYPIGNSIYSSLFRNNLSVMNPEFIGLDNYVNLLKDEIFIQSFKNNLLIAIFTIPTSIALAIAMALFANQVRFGKGFTRVAFFYPTILPMVAVANVWLFIYTPIYGLLGYINPSWRLLGGANTALWAIIVMLIWKQAGYVMIFYISGLHGISRELYEAAQIDGSGPVKSFFAITLPLLKPTTIYVMIITLTNAYKLVDHLYIMTKGGPGNATNMLLFYIFQVGFDFWDVGKASAMTTVLVSLLLIITSVYFFTQDKKAFYN